MAAPTPAPGRALDPMLRALVSVASVVVIGIGLHLVSTLVVTALCGAGIAIATRPVSLALRRHDVSPYLAAAANIGLVLAGLAAFGSLASLALADLEDALPGILTAVEAARSSAVEALRDLRLYGLARGVGDLGLADTLQPFLTDGVFGTVDLLTGMGLVIFVSVFLIVEAVGLRGKLEQLGRRRPGLSARLAETVHEVQRYLVIKTGTSLATGLLAAGICAAAGVSTPLVWGLLAFALNFVPVAGSLIAAVPAVLLAAGEHGLEVAGLVGAGYAAVNLLIGSVLEPRLMGRALGLSPVVVLLAVALWGTVLGPMGALLSVPLTVILRIFCARSERLQWLAILLAPGPALDPAGRRP